MPGENHSIVYLVPVELAEDTPGIEPSYIISAMKDCRVIFAENERTARRFLKKIWKEIVIDDYEWFAIHKAEEEQLAHFRQRISQNKNIAIISEAGCPGIADPGQVLVQAAQEMGAKVRPLIGPSSIVLALMASGMNGQHFEFTGYLPIDNAERTKAIKNLEAASAKDHSTKIFIETPYRNNQLIETILKTCSGTTKFCIAAELTADSEFIRTMTIAEWRKQKTDFHKKPVIFLLQA